MSAALVQSIEDALGRPGWQLNLGSELAARFRAATATDRVWTLRRDLLAMLCINTLFLGLDVAHGLAGPGIALRLGLALPLTLTAVALLSTKCSSRDEGILAGAPVAVMVASAHYLGMLIPEQDIAERYVFGAGILAISVNFWPARRFVHALWLALVNVVAAVAIVLAMRGASGLAVFGGLLVFNALATVSTLRVTFLTERNSQTVFLYRLRDGMQVEALYEANRELEIRSRTDMLTGLPNRRAFEDDLRATLARDRPGPARPALLLVDIDHLRAFNAAAGHAAGDACLRSVALALGDAMPADGVLARYGGEEFAVLLPDTDARAAERTAERLRLAVSREAIAHPGRPGSGHVSVSIGVAAWRGRGTTPDDLIAAADRALQAAKAGGRGRVSLLDDPRRPTL